MVKNWIKVKVCVFEICKVVYFEIAHIIQWWRYDQMLFAINSSRHGDTNAMSSSILVSVTLVGHTAKHAIGRDRSSWPTFEQLNLIQYWCDHKTLIATESPFRVQPEPMVQWSLVRAILAQKIFKLHLPQNRLAWSSWFTFDELHIVVEWSYHQILSTITISYHLGLDVGVLAILMSTIAIK